MPNNKTGFKLKASILALAMLGAPMAANAAGMGKLTVLSALGQPLRAEIELSAAKDELSSINAKLGTPEQFRQQGVDYASALGSVNVSVEKRSNGTAVVRLTSDRPINEPFLDVLVELNWTAGRLLREYTFLLDPPDLPRKAPVPVAVPEVRSASSASTAPIKVEAAPAPVATTVAAPVPAPVAESANDEKKSVKPAKPVPAKVEETRTAPASTNKNTNAATREVKRGDTLAKIAAESAHDGVSLDQMLVAIFSGNKDAFAGENMNRLKSGRILTIPTKEEAASLTDGEARKTIAVHSSNFTAYRKKLAEAATAAPAADAAAGQSSAGKIAPKVEDKAPVAASGRDKVEVSRTELGKDGKAAKLAEEDRIAKERALKDAQSRVKELEKNVAELKKLNEMGSKSLAEAEKKASSDKGAAAQKKAEAEKLAAEKAAADKLAAEKIATEKAAAEKAAAEKAAADKAASDKAAADKLAADKAAADKAEADKAAADKAAADKLAEAAPVEGVKPADAAAEKPAEEAPPPPKKKVVLPPPEPEPEPTFMESNAGLVFGGGGLLAALAGFFGYREFRRRKEAAMEQPSQFGEPSAMSSVFGTTGGQSVDTRNVSIGDNFSQSSVGGLDGAAGVDPVAEAEVYMAYGRDAQAEEILIEAMKTEPTRHAIHLKLLELYSARKSVRPFEEVALDLYKQTNGGGNDWAKAAAMGQALDPDNQLYRSGAPSAAADAGSVDTGNFNSFGSGTSTVIMPAGQLARMAAEAPHEETMKLNEPVQVAEPIYAPAPEPVVELEEPFSVSALDFDLDLGSDAAGTTTAAAAPVLDFDLDLGSDAESVSGSSDGMSLDLDMHSESPAPEPAAPSMDIEFDLGLPPASKPEVAAADPDLDYDLELEASLVAAASAAESSAPELAMAEPEAMLPAMDFGSISLDLETPPAAFEATAQESSAIPDADENPEVATKLELAQAYEEMGDKEGMRELLQEVLGEGSAAQQDLARNKLAQHGL